ncbi:MAG: hypothetical protein KDC30_07565, partial [Saprospiraceae bacterium]|nr:hypothetical protein [Saprospiraceae bacterium]
MKNMGVRKWNMVFRCSNRGQYNTFCLIFLTRKTKSLTLARLQGFHSSGTSRYDLAMETRKIAGKFRQNSGQAMVKPNGAFIFSANSRKSCYDPEGVFRSVGGAPGLVARLFCPDPVHR